jgi:hypothetical protein
MFLSIKLEEKLVIVKPYLPKGNVNQLTLGKPMERKHKQIQKNPSLSAETGVETNSECREGVSL